MGEFSVTHLLIVAIVLLVFFGPSRLPGLGQSLGKAIRGFKEGLNEVTNPHEPAEPAKPSVQLRSGAVEPGAPHAASANRAPLANEPHV